MPDHTRMTRRHAPRVIEALENGWWQSFQSNIPIFKKSQAMGAIDGVCMSVYGRAGPIRKIRHVMEPPKKQLRRRPFHLVWSH